MKTKILKYWTDLRSSFWFFPTLMVMVAAGLAFFFVGLDRQIGAGSSPRFDWIYGGGAQGASAVLETIAGSMATITGVVFSMTLVALSLASSQFGPRLLLNFMSDTVNQIVLGTFVSTFLYCLLVLRTVRRADEIAFVPHLSVTVGVLFALGSLGVLIYFIHHVAVSIQIDEIVAQVEANLLRRIEALFPTQIGKEMASAESAGSIPIFAPSPRLVCAKTDGYLQLIDTDDLMKIAMEANTVVQILYRPGSYINAGSPLVEFRPSGEIDDEQVKRICSSFLLGKERTSSQDVDYLLCELVEIAVRALSPGINDPFTALTCIDRLGSALSRLAQRDMPSRFRYDINGKLRLVAPSVEFARFVDTAFDQIRENGRGTTAVTIRLLETLTVVGRVASRAEDRRALSRQAEIIIIGARADLVAAHDRQRAEDEYRRFCDLVENMSCANQTK